MSVNRIFKTELFSEADVTQYIYIYESEWNRFVPTFLNVCIIFALDSEKDLSLNTIHSE